MSSSTLSSTVVSIELSAPPAPIASTTAAIDTLSGASHRFQPSRSPKEYQKPCSFPPTDSMYARSEEHTSELQSQSNLVCRLLLEKKKKKKKKKKKTHKNTEYNHIIT